MKRGCKRISSLLLTCLWLVCAASPCRSGELAELSLHELVELEVTTASRRSHTLAETSAAVFVITAEDIRRSGATSIPEALRLAPGLLVAQVDAGKWAVSARSFNSLYANKLLVLMDGRSLFSPLFPSVFWDAQDTVLEDIERIEVIRGPAATVWGSNAVNGVINIITESARSTEGGLVAVAAGSEERAAATLRYGASFGTDGHWRGYLKGRRQEDSAGRDGRGAADAWESVRGGFRLDWLPPGKDDLTLQGDLSGGRAGFAGEEFDEGRVLPLPSQDDAQLAGGNLLARWRHRLGDRSKTTLQFYYDWSRRRSFLFGEERHTADIDFQHTFERGRHGLVWGAGARTTRGDFEDHGNLTMAPARRTEHIYSAFLQDEISLVAEVLTLTAGARLEHTRVAGRTLSPSLRLLWLAGHGHSLWAAASRAERIPSRFERDSRTLVPVASDGPLPLRGELSGNDDFDPEEVAALEVGYRFHPEGAFNLDVAAFYNDYDRLRSFEVGSLTLEDSPLPLHGLLHGSLDNNLEGETWGMELAANWQPIASLRLKGAYTFARGSFRHRDRDDDSFAVLEEEKIPRHQASLRSELDFSGDIELDLWLRYVDELAGGAVPAYLELDTRLAWRPRAGLELALVGQNLLDASHPEFPTESLFGVAATEVQRGLYAKLDWRF